MYIANLRYVVGYILHLLENAKYALSRVISILKKIPLVSRIPIQSYILWNNVRSVEQKIKSATYIIVNRYLNFVLLTLFTYMK